MSARNTPVAYMGPARYATWYEKRTRQLKRERVMRYLAACSVVALSCLVAFVVVGLVLGAAP